MKTSVFHKHVAKLFDKVAAILEEKNARYSHAESNAFKNFEMSEYHNLTTREIGVAVRLGDKYSRLATLLTANNPTSDEAIIDTVEDFIGYLAILHAMLKEKSK